MWPFNSNAELGRFMKLKQQPTAIPLDAMDSAFREGKATGIVIYRCCSRTWMFTFTARNPGTAKVQSFTLKTQRGKVRTWSDPRNLLQWLHDRYGVSEGSFVLLDEESEDED